MLILCFLHARVIFQLEAQLCPRTSHNFLRLCEGSLPLSANNYTTTTDYYCGTTTSNTNSHNHVGSETKQYCYNTKIPLFIGWNNPNNLVAIP